MVKPIPEEVADEARRRVADGFTPIADIVESLIDFFVTEYDEGELQEWAEQAVESSLAAQLAAEKDWPRVTDCDRLDRAFEALEQTGIIARQNFSCCQTCGSAEIRDEGEGDGYAYYHMQDTDHAVEGTGLHLAYGPLRSGVDAVVIGKRVVAALEKEGLTVDWNGSVEKRIWVNLKWQRRRELNG
jgi:hypothetical protein